MAFIARPDPTRCISKSTGGRCGIYRRVTSWCTAYPFPILLGPKSERKTPIIGVGTNGGRALSRQPCACMRIAAHRLQKMGRGLLDAVCCRFICPICTRWPLHVCTTREDRCFRRPVRQTTFWRDIRPKKPMPARANTGRLNSFRWERLMNTKGQSLIELVMMLPLDHRFLGGVGLVCPSADHLHRSSAHRAARDFLAGLSRGSGYESLPGITHRDG